MIPIVKRYRLSHMVEHMLLEINVCSAKSNEEHIVKGLSLGSNDYMVKPFGRNEMLARIKSHLKTRDGLQVSHHRNIVSHFKNPAALPVCTCCAVQGAYRARRHNL